MSLTCSLRSFFGGSRLTRIHLLQCMHETMVSGTGRHGSSTSLADSGVYVDTSSGGHALIGPCPCLLEKHQILLAFLPWLQVPAWTKMGFVQMTDADASIARRECRMLVFPGTRLLLKQLIPVRVPKVRLLALGCYNHDTKHAYTTVNSIGCESMCTLC